MGVKESELEDVQMVFSAIIKRAYDRGMSEQGVTVQMLMEELRLELKRMRSTQENR